LELFGITLINFFLVLGAFIEIMFFEPPQRLLYRVLIGLSSHRKEFIMTCVSLTPQFIRTIKDPTNKSLSKLEYFKVFVLTPHTIRPPEVIQRSLWTVFEVSFI
jgi:hypothetical protein